MLLVRYCTFMFGSPKIAALLIEHGADIEYVAYPENGPPLFQCCNMGRPKVQLFTFVHYPPQTSKHPNIPYIYIHPQTPTIISSLIRRRRQERRSYQCWPPADLYRSQEWPPRDVVKVAVGRARFGDHLGLFKRRDESTECCCLLVAMVTV